MPTSQLRRAVLLAVGILAAGCNPAPQQTQPARPVPVRPARIVVLADISESVLFHNVEAVGPEHLRQLAQLAARAGGEIAFGTVPMPQDRSLVRASFSPPPTPPGRSSNVFRQMQVEGAYKRRLAEWEAVTGELVDWFVREAQVLLRPRRERGSPVFRALRMAEVFLTEHGAAGLRVVLASTDGFDTTQDPPVQKLPDGTQFIVVNGDGSVGSLAHLRPLLFSNMSAAVEYVTKLTEVR